MPEIADQGEGPQTGTMMNLSRLTTLCTPQVVIAELLLLTTCTLGDYLMTSHPYISGDMVLKAVTDSAVHGGVGLLSWGTVTGGVNSYHDAVEIAVCGCLASAIDIDHFIAAKSFGLKVSLSLTKRPPFHNTTIIPILAIALYAVVELFKLRKLGNLPWMFTVAWLSHHIRDGTRRGLWFAPFGSTPPLIPPVVYIGVIMVLPLVVRVCFQLSHRSRTDATVGTLDSLV